MTAKTRIRNKIIHHYKKMEYFTDADGRKTKVVMPIKSFDEILEDLNDLSVVADRKNERPLSLDYVVKDLKKNGLI